MIDHISLVVKDYNQSKAFYLAALAPLGYEQPHYYGAFVLDPNGHNLEAVCHGALVR